MNKQFSQIITVYLENQVSEINNSVITPYFEQQPITLYAMPFQISDVPTDGAGDKLMVSTVTLDVDKLLMTEANTLRTPRSVFVQLEANGTGRVLGAPRFPAKLVLTPGLNSDQITITARVPMRYFR